MKDRHSFLRLREGRDEGDRGQELRDEVLPPCGLPLQNDGAISMSYSDGRGGADGRHGRAW